LTIAGEPYISGTASHNDGACEMSFDKKRIALRAAAVLATAVLLGGPGLRNAARAADVVINEINYHPASDLEKEEFIELWNYGSTPVDISGWAFDDGVLFTFPAGTTLGPDEYIVVAKDPATLASLAPEARILGPWTGGLQNDGERIRLVDNHGLVVDEVRYNDAPPWPTTPDGQGASLERICPTWPSDDPANWTAATSMVGSGWVQMTKTGQATSSRLYIYLDGAGEALVDDVSIVEEGSTTNLVRNPSFEEPFAWGDGSSGWTATGNHSNSDREADADAHSGSYVCHIVSTGVGGSYSNSVNQYTQPLQTGGPNYTLSLWVKPVSGNVSITARLSGSGLLMTHSFAESLMTPGEVNSAYQANLPPFVSRLDITPECPKVGEPVSVSAYIRDSDGVSSASLLYQTFRSSGHSQVITLPMIRTGGTEEVGLWQAQIPAQPNRTLVRLRVRAADSLGASRTSPDPTEARDTYSYFQYADDIASSLPVAFLYEFGPAVPQDSLRGNVALIIRPPGPESYWEVYDHIIRTSRVGGHNIFFLKHYEYDGMSGINVVFEWKPRYALSEYLTYEVHRALGSLSEKVGHFRFFYNDSPLGYYLMFEQPNKTFLARSGLDNDGNLYKIRYNAPPEKKTNISLGNDDIVELQNSVQSLTGSALTQYIFDNLAVDQLINYYCGNQLTSDWDGYFNNHYLYHDIEDTGLWYIIPWDRDKTWGDNDAYQRHPAPGGGYLYPVYDMPILFGANGTPRSGTDSDTWWRPPGWLSGPFLADPVVQKRYIKRLEDVTLRIFTTDRWFPVIDALEERLEPEVIERARIRGDNVDSALAVFHNDIESFRQQVIHRRAFILSQVNPLTYPNVTEVQPSSGSALSAPPAEIVVRFTEPISTSTINSATFRLIRSGGDGEFGQANDVEITPSTPPALTAFDEARLSLEGLNLPPDRYRIILSGTGLSRIKDTVGNSLDGEYTGTLPSGDGVAGGDFVSEFEIRSQPPSAGSRHWESYR